VKVEWGTPAPPTPTKTKIQLLINNAEVFSKEL